MSDRKNTYRDFVEAEEEIPLFMEPWWLDVVCGSDGWDVAIFEKGGQTVGVLPYYLKRKYGLPVVTMPKLTPAMGPWIRYFEGQKRATRISHEKEVFSELISQLPEVVYFRQNFHPNISNWLPFYWQGYHATVRYTYVIDELDDLDELWDSFDSRVRRMVRKARDSGVTVEKTDDLGRFIELNRLTYSRQDRELPYSEQLVRRIDSECRERNVRSIYIAYGESNRPHSAAYCVQDETTTYYLMSGADPELRHSGANALTLWQSIKDAAERGIDRYDFEGSSVENIERFFRRFAGRQIPYFQIIGMNRMGLALNGFRNAFRACVNGDATASNILP